MDKKGKNEQKREDLTEAEKKETVKMVNKMTSTFEFIQHDLHNTQWMDSDHAPLYKGLAGGLTFMHTLSLINLTRWLKRLTIVLIVITIMHLVLILGPKLSWF